MSVAQASAQEGIRKSAFSERTIVAVTIVTAAVASICGAQSMNPDGISYLDMGDSIFRGDWSLAVNGYWGPMYALLLGVANRIVEPGAAWEFPLAHLVNFLIFLSTLAAFRFFLNELVCFEDAKAAEGRPGVFEGENLRIIGITMFAVAAIAMVTLNVVSPDMLLMAVVFLISGVVLRIRGGIHSLATWAALGGLIGLGYLVKVVLLPVGIIFLFCAILSARRAAGILTRVSVAMLMIVMIVAPWAFAISKKLGHASLGETGKINYLTLVDGYKYKNAQPDDGPALKGIRQHTERILESPAVYRFPTTDVTNISWYDPSIWFNGAKTVLVPRRQLTQLIHAAFEIPYLTFRYLGIAIVAGALLLLAGIAKKFSVWRHFELLIPAIAATSAYALIFIESRYIAPFLLLIVIALLCSLEAGKRDPGFLRGIVRGIALITILAMFPTIRGMLRNSGQMIQGPDTGAALAARELGVKADDKVAIVGDSVKVYFPRLLRLHIAAEVEDPEEFWTASDDKRRIALRKLAEAGASRIFAQDVPLRFHNDWIQLGTSNYYLYRPVN